MIGHPYHGGVASNKRGVGVFCGVSVGPPSLPKQTMPKTVYVSGYPVNGRKPAFIFKRLYKFAIWLLQLCYPRDDGTRQWALIRKERKDFPFPPVQ